jgi:hypothetical protein
MLAHPLVPAAGVAVAGTLLAVTQPPPAAGWLVMALAAGYAVSGSP